MQIIELKSITKSFGEITANDHIDFTLNQGEIHSILGENGAGKSTLMNILSGLYKPDGGKIFIRGNEVKFKSPGDAINRGIGMIHQHFMLIQAYSALENIILGTKLPIILDRKKLRKDVEEICNKLGFELDLKSCIWQLSTGEQQKVEIVKALYRGVKILILDEPTAILTPQESRSLFRMLESMKKQNYSIIFVSHKLKEVLSISDRITILRRGKLVQTMPNKHIDNNTLAKLMVGRYVNAKVSIQEQESRGKVVLNLENVIAKGDKGYKALKDISLSLESGEILGIAGVAGNGQTELAQVITGLRKTESGSIKIMDNEVTGKSVKQIIKSGVAYIPEDRIKTGSIADLDIYDNILLKRYDNFSFLDSSEIEKYSEKVIDEYDVNYPDLSTPIKHLSGGNLQKLILARELYEIPKLLIAAYPTRGLDVSSVEYIRRKIVEIRNRGSAILLISEDLDELISISDRIGVMYEGRLTFISEKDINKIGLAMAGSYE
ncbi:ATP-binding cassette domain-containing protein [Candidatus Poribacteria bacterium]|nr:ATP-binding cassette domain-containing protein [Candidatus Poribacteria bacterium]